MKKGTLLIFLGIIGFLFVPSFANAATKTVCASGCDYTTLSDAITGAATDDTISLSAGTYATGAVTINKNLTITGASKDTTIITLNADVTNWISVDPNYTLTISRVTIDGQSATRTVNNALYIKGSLSISDTIVKNVKSAAGEIGTGIYSDAADCAGASLTVNNVTMSGIEYAGIWLLNANGTNTTTINNFNLTCGGSGMTNQQYGIISEGGRTATVTNTNISKCYGVDGVGNTSAAIWVHGNKQTTSPYSQMCFKNFKDNINFYVETSDLSDNLSSLYVGRETRDDGEIAVRYSLMGPIRVRHESYVDTNFNFWGEGKKAADIAAMVNVPDINTFPNDTIFFDSYYTRSSATLVKSKLLDWELRGDKLELTVGEGKSLDSLIGIQNKNNLYYLCGEDELQIYNHITYTSSDTSIATVNNTNGTSTGIKEGATTINTTSDGWNTLAIGVNVVSNNPKTADLPVIIICFIGLIGLGFGIYKLNKTKYDY